MMNNNWYDEAVEETLKMQREEIAELEATIAYMEQGGDTSELHNKMLAECRQELVEAVEDLKSAEKYAESMKKYAA